MVNALGGNAGRVAPLLNGTTVKGRGGRCPTHGHEGDHDHEHGYRGKIWGLIFDRWGDFEGFKLDTGDCVHRFFSRELGNEEAVRTRGQERLLS
jgi:hypothetical protein